MKRVYCVIDMTPRNSEYSANQGRTKAPKAKGLQLKTMIFIIKQCENSYCKRVRQLELVESGSESFPLPFGDEVVVATNRIAGRAVAAVRRQRLFWIGLIPWVLREVRAHTQASFVLTFTCASGAWGEAAHS